MKQPKLVEIFADVICKNCVSYSQSQCCKVLPSIPTNLYNKCSEGNWFFDGNIINFRLICLELVPFDFVTDVADLLCKVCIYYDSSRKKCHFRRQNACKTGPNDWCDIGLWLYRDDDNEVTLVSLFHFIDISDKEKFPGRMY